jgi:hypothetical protein
LLLWFLLLLLTCSLLHWLLWQCWLRLLLPRSLKHLPLLHWCWLIYMLLLYHPA